MKKLIEDFEDVKIDITPINEHYFGFRTFLKWVITLFLILLCNDCDKNHKHLNLIFISLDTTRYDYIDTGKGAKALTPEIKQFSKRAVVFENAYTTIPLTLPAHLSIFTSCLPHELGVIDNDCFFIGRKRMIQEVLKKHGYLTRGLISLGTLSGSTGISKGFDVYYDNYFSKQIFFIPAEKITSISCNILEELKARKFFFFIHYSDPHTPYGPPHVYKPFQIMLNGVVVSSFNSYSGSILRENIILTKGKHIIRFNCDDSQKEFSFFILRKLEFGNECSSVFSNIQYSKDHYNGSHLLSPMGGEVSVSCNSDSYMKLFQVIPILKRQYATYYYKKEIEYMDHHLGILFRKLKELDLIKKTIIVVFSDHGEGLGERDQYFGHARYLNRQFIHVPLIVRLPDGNQDRIETPVSLASISPMVLNLLGLREPTFTASKNYLDIDRRGKGKYNPVFSFGFKPSSIKNKFSIIQQPYQGIFYLDGNLIIKREFYNLSISQSFNPLDQIFEENLVKGEVRISNLFCKEVQKFRDIFDLNKNKKTRHNHRNMDKLKALGYLFP
jgi:hypothetical protein